MKGKIRFFSGKIQKNHKGEYQIYIAKLDHSGHELSSEWVLLKDLTLRELSEFWNFISAGPSIRRFGSREIGIKRITNLLDTFEVPDNKPVRAHEKPERVMSEEKKEKKRSYAVIIRELLDNKKGVITRDEIMEATGCDERNAAVAMSILKNPGRTKEPIDWLYHRGTRTYYLEGSSFDPVAADEKVAAEKKAKKAESKKSAAKTEEKTAPAKNAK